MGGEQLSTKVCVKCNKLIFDEYLTTLLNGYWHDHCVTCADCGVKLNQSCFAKNGNIYCQVDFYKYKTRVLLLY